MIYESYARDIPYHFSNSVRHTTEQNQCRCPGRFLGRLAQPTPESEAYVAPRFGVSSTLWCGVARAAEWSCLAQQACAKLRKGLHRA